MFNNLYLLNYNNYYNRLVKKEDTLEGYQPYIVASFGNINFNPNDHVSAEIILNIDDDLAPDYLIVIDSEGEIASRWFIIESMRVRGQQYNLLLQRDVVVDYYNIIMNSPCFIEKAIVPDSDSAIFNSEEMTVNRIKTSETAIKDNTQCSWLVAYIAREKANGEEYAIDGEVVPSGLVDISVDRDSWTFKDYINGNKKLLTRIQGINFSINMYNKVGFNDPTYLQVNLYKQNLSSTPSASFNRSKQTNIIASGGTNLSDSEFNARYKNTYNSILNYLPVTSGLTFDEIPNANFDALNGLKIRFTGEETIYQIQITSKITSYQSPKTGSVYQGDLVYQKVQSLWSNILAYKNPQDALAVGRFYNYSIHYTEMTMNLVPIGGVKALRYNIPIARQHLEDAPYDMICAPYDSVSIKIDDSTTIRSQSQDILSVFNDIVVKNAGDNAIVYDIQRLPYCPIPALEMINGTLDATTYNAENQLFKITTGTFNRPTAAIFACSVSNFYKSIQLDSPIVIDNAKVQSICDMYRICSPNYNGVFEFDPAMNGGLSGFNIYCTYKPFNPYIQVSPIFGRLYGENYADARGLICGGEWSLPIVTSAWETYERQNANYQNTFSRQIENMKVTHSVQREQEIWSAVAGALQGSASGAMIGGLMGGGAAGMIGGGIAGGVLSGIGGIRDIQLNELLRNEAIDYTIDQFGFQLGNIQALPMSLSRTSAFTINNKIFPFLEYYTCTQEEKEALANKIAYNGMTIMRIGKITNYVGNSWSYGDITAQNYIKGKIIRCEGLEQEYHLANTIAKEINQGLYFGGTQ